MPGVELAEHTETTPAVTDPDEQAETAIHTRIAAKNAGLGVNEPGDLGPHLVEAKPEEMDDDGSIYEIKDMIPGKPPGAIEIGDGDSIPGTEEADQGAGDTPESELLNHKGDDESSLHPETADATHGGLSDQEANKESDEDDEGVRIRRSKRNRKVPSRFEGFEHSMFAMYDEENAEKEVDEYMHATLSEEKCNVIDSYLVPVFEFIIAQYSLKAGLKKAEGKDKKAI